MTPFFHLVPAFLWILTEITPIDGIYWDNGYNWILMAVAVIFIYTSILLFIWFLYPMGVSNIGSTVSTQPINLEVDHKLDITTHL